MTTTADGVRRAYHVPAKVGGRVDVFIAAVRAAAGISTDRACGCSARFERHADGCPTTEG